MKGQHSWRSVLRAIGTDFATLEKAERLANADVLDAWFDPSPLVIEKSSSTSHGY